MDFFHPSDNDYGKRLEMRGNTFIEILWPHWKKYAGKDIFLKIIDIGWISNYVDFMNDAEGIIALISAILR
jgi:hypothetical protein